MGKGGKDWREKKKYIYIYIYIYKTKKYTFGNKVK